METPIDKVLTMRSQGLSNNQIIQNLQREGFDQNTIFEAFNQADAKGGIEPIPQTMQQSPPVENPMSMPQQPFMSGGQPMGAPQQGVSTEELVEALIDEKWNDLMQDINKIIDWKSTSETRLAKMEQQITDMKTNFTELQKAIVGKVGEYDKHILEVGAEIQAMEKVFKNVLPSFTENVNELSRVADKLKEK